LAIDDATVSVIASTTATSTAVPVKIRSASPNRGVRVGRIGGGAAGGGGGGAFALGLASGFWTFFPATAMRAVSAVRASAFGAPAFTGGAPGFGAGLGATFLGAVGAD